MTEFSNNSHVGKIDFCPKRCFEAILSVILAFVLVVSLAPSFAFADPVESDDAERTPMNIDTEVGQPSSTDSKSGSVFGTASTNEITIPATFDSSMVVGAPALSASVTYNNNFVKGEKVRFTYAVSGNTLPLKYRIFSFSMKEGNSWKSIIDTSKNIGAYSENNYFEYEFNTAGTYQLKFEAAEYSDNGDGTRSLVNHARFSVEFTIDQANGFDSVQNKVAAVVEQCEKECAAANDTSKYAKALWLNDWIIKNTTYDDSLTYSSAEGVFGRGEGTCEGYHDAYVMLLNKAGIETRRVDSYGDTHVWTGVKLDDGQWYNIDTTWNDPAYSDASIDLNHLYFALPTSIMQHVHKRWNGTYDIGYPNRASFDANSYEYNYFIRSGKISQYTSPYVSSGTSEYSVRNHLEKKETTFSLKVAHDSWVDSYKEVIYSLVAHQLQKENWGEGVKVSVGYSNNALHFSVGYDGSNPAIPLSDAIVFDVADLTYNGSAQTQVPRVVVAGKELAEGVDYTYSITNNTDVSSYDKPGTVTITGKGNYCFTTTKTFYIKQAGLNAAKIDTIPDQTYDGKAKTPAVNIKLGSMTLVKDKDYTLSYSNNTNVGTAKVTITGKGNFVGTITSTFTIKAASGSGSSGNNPTTPTKTTSISSAKVTATGTTKNAYSGGVGADSITVTLNGKTLSSANYTVKYNGSATKPTKAGTYAITVEGNASKGYSGTAACSTKLILHQGPNVSFTTQVKFSSVYNASFVLDASGATPKRGANISIWTDNGGANQKWTLVPDGNGYYYIKSVSKSNYVLDASGSSPKQGANVSIWDNNIGNNQKWILEPYNGAYLIRNVANQSLVLDASGGSPKIGANVTAWGCNKGKNQQWKVYAVTYPSFDSSKTYEIVSRTNSKYVLDAAGGTPKKGANISIWDHNGGKNQKWKIVSAGNGYYYIQSLSNPKYVLDASGATPRRGSNISIWDNNNGLNQKWKIEQLADGSMLIRSAANQSLVLDASGATPRRGANVSAWTSNGGNNQKWSIRAS